ncbi:MAG: hypothetical protein ACREDU_00235, partial [Methylocella sp.]
MVAKDWERVAEFVKKELDARANSSFRKIHEQIWREVDRQVAMQPMKRTAKTQQEKLHTLWRSAVELGELSKASEVISADVRRIVFPTARAWFECYSEGKTDLDQDNTKQKSELQKLNGSLRAMMTQQHLDFGLKARFDTAVKEALHHGSFVAIPHWQELEQYDSNSRTKVLAAPAWCTYSMWNAYPDTSPAVYGNSLFYDGNMIVRTYMPLHKLKAMKGTGWMNVGKVGARQNRNKNNETEDAELICWYGDIGIERRDGADIYLPNCKFIVANDVPVYYAENELPFSPVIFAGYERQDIRDPYCTSPLIKLSPTQKLASTLANQLVDGIELKMRPPLLYDGRDPTFLKNGGPVIVPGYTGPTQGSADFKQIDVGEPTYALNGLELFLSDIKQGTGVGSPRTGVG